MTRLVFRWYDPLTVQTPWGVVIRAQPRIGAGDERGRGGQFATADTPEGLPPSVTQAIEKWRKYNRARVGVAKMKRRFEEKEGGMDDLDKMELDMEAGLASLNKKDWLKAQAKAKEEGWHINALGKITQRPEPPALAEIPPRAKRGNSVSVRDYLDIGGELTTTQQVTVEISLEAVDQIHGYTGLPPVAVTIAGEGGRFKDARLNTAQGEYHYFVPPKSIKNNNNWAKTGISLSRDMDDLTFLHELGHSIDFSAIDKRDPATRSALTLKTMTKGRDYWDYEKMARDYDRTGKMPDDPSPADRVLMTISKSKGFQKMKEVHRWHQDNAGIVNAEGQQIDTSDPNRTRRGLEVEISDDYTSYYMRPTELFARSYAQYIAHRSDSEYLKSGLDSVRGREVIGREMVNRQVIGSVKGGAWDTMPSSSTQWDDDDFEPIAQEFDRMFVELGLATAETETERRIRERYGQ